MNFTNISNFGEPLESHEMTSTLSVYLSKGETAGLVVFLVFFGFAGFLQNLVLILSISLTDGFADAPANLFVLSLARLCGFAVMRSYNSAFHLQYLSPCFQHLYNNDKSCCCSDHWKYFSFDSEPLCLHSKTFEISKNNDIQTNCNYDRSQYMVGRHPYSCRGRGWLDDRK